MIQPQIIATLILCLILFANCASAFAELIPSSDFAVTIDKGIYVNCGELNGIDNFERGALQLEKTDEKAVSAYGDLQLASALAAPIVQVSVNIISPILVQGPANYLCLVASISSLQKSLDAAKEIARQIDEESTSLEFEIGSNFTGPGANELIAFNEINHGQGELGKTALQLQSDYSQSLLQINLHNPSKTATTAKTLLEKNGGLQQMEKFLQTLKKSKDELKELEDSLLAQFDEKDSQTKNKIAELKQQDIGQLGEIQLIKLQYSNNAMVTKVTSIATTPAGLLKQSEVYQSQGEALYKSLGKYKNYGRAANRINTLEKAISKTALAQSAADDSLSAAQGIALLLQEEVDNLQVDAKKIESPFGKLAIEHLFDKFKTGTTLAQDIINLNQLASELKELIQVYNGTITEQDKTELRVDIREVQRIALSAQKLGLTPASEIFKKLSDTYDLIEKAKTGADLMKLKLETQQNKNLLFSLIEQKYNYLKNQYSDATQLEEQNIYTPLEENQLDDLRDVFTTDKLPENIDSITKIENSLKQLIQTGLKRVGQTNSTLPKIVNTNGTIAANTSTVMMPAKSAAVTQNNTSIETIDFNAISEKLKEIEEKGTKAFYSPAKSKKTLEEIKFENLLKEAQAKAKELIKNPTNEKAEEVKKNLEGMEAVLSTVEKNTELEIAIAEQRGNNVDDATAKWKEGRFIEALQATPTAKKTQLSEITGQVVKTDDSKLWAIGISLVIILIGAAYLFYMKKDEPA